MNIRDGMEARLQSISLLFSAFQLDTVCNGTVLYRYCTGTVINNQCCVSRSWILDSSVADPGCLSPIPDPDFWPSRILDLKTAT
jgi:hypothetical protein